MNKQPHPVDIHVGSRVKLRRNVLGLSQAELSRRLGLTFQQIQKYENGTNRVSASRLFEMGVILDVPVSFFFDGLLGPKAQQSSNEITAKVLRTAGQLHHLPDSSVRDSLISLISALHREATGNEAE